MVLILAWGVGFGTLAAWTARLRARHPIVWFGFGAILGPLATAILTVAPPGYCPTCLEPTRGWLYVCAWCGSDVRRRARAPVVGPSVSVPVEPGPTTPARTISRPPIEQRAGGPMDAATRTAEASVRVTPDGHPGDVTLAGTGVYVGGTVPLRAGSRYGLVVRGSTFDIVGPVDQSPEQIVVSRQLDAIDATVMGGRLLVSAIGAERGKFIVAFENLTGAGATELEQAVRASSRPTADRWNGQ